MRARLLTRFASTVVLLTAAGCDAADPVGSELALAFRRTDTPSGTSVVVVSYNRLDVSWQDNSPNETGFEVHRGPAVAGPFTFVGNAAAGATSYADLNVNASTQYCYEVRAYRTTGKTNQYSDFSNVACGTTKALPVPAAPSGANAVPSSSTVIALTWQDNSTDENSFRVEFSLDAGANWQSIGWVPGANSTRIDHGGRTPDQAICYRVIAVNTFGDSPPSNTDCTAAPLSPDQLSATGASGPAIDLAWNDRSTVEDGYEVRRAGPDNQWTTIAHLVEGSHGYHDVGIVGGVRYNYDVAATKDGGYSDFSSVSGMSISGPPPVPTAISATPQNSSLIAVNWAGPTDNVESFRIERSTDGGANWSSAGTNPWYYQSFFDGVVSEQRFCYRVIAINAAGESASSVACATAPAFATDLVATSVSGGIIDLSWTDNSNVEEGYEVWQVVYDCGYYYYYYCYPYYVFVEARPANTTSFRIWGNDPNTFYSYVVVARKDGGYSDYSNEAGAYPGPLGP